MSGVKERIDDVDETSVENTVKFVLTLIVTTVIAAVAVYVLGAAVIEAGAGGSTHRAAIAAMHRVS
jgi:hypothetical protein